eukprot:Nk52_evm24s1916 gene=Nk52_evmTU24s1916
MSFSSGLRGSVKGWMRMAYVTLCLSLLIPSSGLFGEAADADAYSDGVVRPDNNKFQAYKKATSTLNEANSKLYGGGRPGVGSRVKQERNYREFEGQFRKEQTEGQSDVGIKSEREMSEALLGGGGQEESGGVSQALDNVFKSEKDEQEQMDSGLGQYGPGDDGGASLQANQKTNYVSPVEFQAACGYNILYDTETVPIFELTSPMKQQNIVGVTVNTDTKASVDVTGASSMREVLSNIQQAKNTNAGLSGDLGIGAGKGTKKFGGNLGMELSMSKSESFNNVQNMKMKKDTRFSIVTVSLSVAEVTLTRSNMMLKQGFLDELRRLPIIPKAADINDVRSFLENPQNSQYIHEYFRFFDKYGTHYRRKSRFGGSLRYVFKSSRSAKNSKSETSKEALACQSKSVYGSVNYENTRPPGEQKMEDLKALHGDPYDGGVPSKASHYLGSALLGKLKSLFHRREKSSSNTPPQTQNAQITSTANQNQDDEENEDEGEGEDEDSESDEHSVEQLEANMFLRRPFSDESARAKVESWERMVTEHGSLLYEDEEAFGADVNSFRQYHDEYDDLHLYDKEGSTDLFDILRFVNKTSSPFDVNSRLSKDDGSYIEANMSNGNSGTYDIGSSYRQMFEPRTYKTFPVDLTSAAYCLQAHSNFYKALSKGSVEDKKVSFQKSKTSILGFKNSHTDREHVRRRRANFNIEGTHSLSECLADFQRTRNLNQASDKDEKYDIECKGGSGCEQLLFSFSSSPEGLMQRISFWSIMVWRFPVYLNSDAEDYILLDSLFDDTIHWRYVNSTNPKDIVNVSLERITRKDSMSLALWAYFVFHGQQLDASVLCSHLECRTPPILTASGECSCGSENCSLDLASRSMQVGGSTPADNNELFGSLTSVEDAQPACSKSEFWNIDRGECVDLFDVPHGCALQTGGANRVSVRYGGCTNKCETDEMVKIATSHKLCEDQTSEDEKRKSMNPFMEMVGKVSNFFFTKADALSDTPKICSEDVSFCVPLCGDGTYLYSVYQDVYGQATSTIQNYCVQTCPAPFKADPNSMKCIEKCMENLFEKEDPKSGNRLCVEDCGTDIAIDNGSVRYCIKNSVLGFYNASISLASFPSVTCAKGNVYRNHTGWIFFAGQGRVISHPTKASVIMVTAVAVGDLLRGYSILMQKQEGVPEHVKSFKATYDRTGCHEKSPEYLTGKPLYTPPNIGRKAKAIMLFDVSDMNYLVLDESNFELRKARKGEPPLGFILNGPLGGEGGFCTNFMMDNERCRAFEIFSNMNSTIDFGRHSSGALVPMLFYNEVTRTLRTKDVSRYSWRTVIEFHVKERITKPYGTCAGDAVSLKKDTMFDVTFPVIQAPCSKCQVSTYYNGFAYVTGDIPLLELKVGFNFGSLKVKSMYSTFEQGANPAFVLSSIDDRCHITCYLTITNCYIFCTKELVVEWGASPLASKKLSPTVVMKLFDFQVLASGFQEFSYLRACERDWSEFNERCIAALRTVGEAYTKGGAVIKSAIESNVRTRDYVFYTPIASRKAIIPKEMETIGSEAINYISILEKYKEDLDKAVDMSYGTERMRALVLKRDIDLMYGVLAYEPKSKTFSRLCKDVLLDLVLRMRHFRDKLFSMQLVGSGGKSPIILHMCIAGKQKVRYERRSDILNVKATRSAPLKEYATYSWHQSNDNKIGPHFSERRQRADRDKKRTKRQKRDSGAIIASQKSKALDLLNRINVTWNPSDPKDLCAGDQNGFFCMAGYNHTELVVVEFTLHHTVQDNGGGSRTVSDSLRQVCGIRGGECRSTRFSVPGIPAGKTDKYPLGFVMFVLDFENFVLRFDLLVREERFDTEYLTYLSHAYVDRDCFSGDLCYGGDAADVLTLRNSIFADAFTPGVNEIYISSLKMRFNDTEYFTANPFSAYIRPCNPVELSDPLKNRKVLLASYVRFNYADKMEYQDVLFLYLCNTVCEKRILIISINGENVQATAEFSFPDLSSVQNQHIENMISGQPFPPKQVVLRYSEDLAQDTYTLDRYTLPVVGMEYILSNLTSYYEMIDRTEVALRSSPLAEELYPGYLSILSSMRDRLLSVFPDVQLGNMSKSDVDEYEGETFHLWTSPGDIFARLLSELKIYFRFLEVIASVTGQPDRVVSVRQKNDSQELLLHSFSYVEEELKDIQSYVGLGLLKGVQPLSWDALMYFFESSFQPEHQVFKYILVIVDNWVIQINRGLGISQTHCITTSGDACKNNYNPASCVVRYEADPIFGDIHIEITSPCSDVNASPICRTKLIKYKDISMKDDKQLYISRVGNAVIILSPTVYQNTETASVQLAKENTLYPDGYESLLALQKSMCGAFYDYSESVSKRNCTCSGEYRPLNCRCSVKLHEREISNGTCVCDEFNHFIQFPGLRACVCDYSKFFVPDKRDASVCVCDSMLHRVYDSSKRLCVCNEAAGYFEDKNSRNCIYQPSVSVKVTSIRKAACSSGACFDFQTLTCRPNINLNECPGRDKLLTSGLGLTRGPISGMHELQDAGSNAMPKDDNIVKGNTGTKISIDELIDNSYQNQSASQSPSGGLETNEALVKELTVIEGGGQFRPIKILKIGQNIISAVYELSVSLVPEGFALNRILAKLGLSTITDITIENQKAFDHIPESLFFLLANVRSLKIINCNLADLSGSQVLYGLSSLNTLDLSSNSLKAIGKTVFDTVPHLENINLSGNIIEKLDTRIFCLIPKLRALSVHAKTKVCMPVTLFNNNEFSIIESGALLIKPSVNLDYRYKCADENVCGHEGDFRCLSKSAPLSKALKCIPRSSLPDPDPNEAVKVQLINTNPGSEDLFIEVPYSLFFFRAERGGLKILDGKGGTVPLEIFTTVIIRHAHVSSIDVDFFDGLYFLTHVVFENCELSNIEPGAFREMGSLVSLIITGSRIKVISDGTFTGLEKLKILNLQGNGIEEISPKAFHTLGSLEYLNIEGNEIEEIHQMLFDGLSSLNELKLGYNRIRAFPPKLFSKLTSIREIDVSGNRDKVLDDLFLDIPVIPSILRVDLMTIVCLPASAYEATIVLPSSDLVFCLEPGNTSNNRQCPHSSRTCPIGGDICYSHNECNRAPWKGVYNYCSPQHYCICGEFLGGPYCSVPLAHVTVMESVAARNSRFFNIPLYPGSLREHLPPFAEQITLRCPFLDSNIFNNNLFAGMNFIRKIVLDTVYPPTEAIIPDGNFFESHPRVLSENDIITMPAPRWLYPRIIPLTYWDGHFSKHPLERRNYVTPLSDAEAQCPKLYNLLKEASDYTLKGMSPTRAEIFRQVIEHIELRTRSLGTKSTGASENNNSKENVPDTTCGVVNDNRDSLLILGEALVLSSGTTNDPIGLVIIGSIALSTRADITYRLVMLLGEEVSTKGKCLYDRVLPTTSLYDFDIIVDDVSEFWPDKEVISGHNVIVYATKLKAIGPSHFSQLYESLEDSLKLQLYFNYYPSPSRQVVCEPATLFRKGMRVNTELRKCSGCELPSACEYISLTMMYARAFNRYKGSGESSFSSDTSTDDDDSQQEVQKNEKSIVFAFKAEDTRLSQMPLCDFLDKAFLGTSTDKEAGVSLTDIQMYVSSCSAIRLFQSSVCIRSNDNKRLSKFGNVASFVIGPVLGSKNMKLLCSLQDIDVRCLFPYGSLGERSSVAFNFVTDRSLFVYFSNAFLERGTTTGNSNLPPKTRLIIPDQNTVVESEYLKSFDVITYHAHCEFKHDIFAQSCSKDIKKCYPCQRGNFKSPCFEDQCSSHINGQTCSGHGLCVKQTCICSHGWAGTDCSISRCDNSNIGYLPCNGAGRCSLRSGVCRCDNPKTGPNCDSCLTSLDCFNGGLCENGKCLCTEFFGGPLCQYRYVSIRYSTFPFVNRLIYNVRKILLKPFMISEPVTQDSNALISAYKVTGLEINLPISVYEISSVPVSEIPAYLLYGLENLRFLNISGLVNQRHVLEENIARDVLVSGRVFDTVKNLKTLVVAKNQTVIADDLGRYSLRGLNVWMKNCALNPRMCQSTYLSHEPFPVQIFSRDLLEPLKYENVPLWSDGWHIKDDPIDDQLCEKLAVQELKDITMKYSCTNQVSKEYNKKVKILSRNFLSSAANVNLLGSEVLMQTAKLDSGNIKRCGSKVQGNTEDSGASIYTSSPFGYGTFRIKLSFSLSCSTFPTVWLIPQASIANPVYNLYHPDCLGTIQLFGGSYNTWYSNDGLCNDQANKFAPLSRNVPVYNLFEPAYFYSPKSNACVKDKVAGADIDTKCAFSADPYSDGTSHTSSTDNVSCQKTSYLCSKQLDINEVNKYVGVGCRVRSKARSIWGYNGPKLSPKEGVRVTMSIKATITKLGMAISYEYIPQSHQVSAPFTNNPRPSADGKNRKTTREMMMLLHAGDDVPMPAEPWHVNIGVHSLKGSVQDEQLSPVQVLSVEHASLCKPTYAKVNIVFYHDFTSRKLKGNSILASPLLVHLKEKYAMERSGVEDMASIAWLKDFLDREGIALGIYFDEKSIPQEKNNPSQGAEHTCTLTFVPSLSKAEPTGVYRGSLANPTMTQYRYRRYGGKTSISRQEFSEGLLEIGIIYNAAVDTQSIANLARLPPYGCVRPICSFSHWTTIVREQGIEGQCD